MPKSLIERLRAAGLDKLTEKRLAEIYPWGFNMRTSSRRATYPARLPPTGARQIPVPILRGISTCYPPGQRDARSR
jgi:hypothetical protein